MVHLRYGHLEKSSVAQHAFENNQTINIANERRFKRQKRETSYKSKALEKFKQLKNGLRNKYEVEDFESIYETVDEKEYVKRVLDRQDDDWIVDDDGSGYVEDGRDIFDDDLDADSIHQASAKSKGVKRKKGISDPASKATLKYMLSNISSKKKEETQIEDDNMLSDIFGEVDETSTNSVHKEVTSFIPRKQITQNYLKKFAIETDTAEKSPLAPITDEKVSENPVKEGCTESSVDSSSDDVIHKKDDFYSQPEIDDFEEQLDITKIEEIESQLQDAECKSPSQSESLSYDFSTDFPNNFTESSGVKSCSEIDAVEIDAPFIISDKKTFRFFWWDAFEDPEKQKGTIFLFGKTYCSESKSYISCCVAVKNLERQIFLLPQTFMLDDQGQRTKDPVTYKDLYCEFASLIAEPMQIKTYKARLVSKKYAFDSCVPQESDYLEVRYPATDPRINLDFIKRTPKTFSRIFGVCTSNLEKFLLDAKIKGPCWLDIKNPEINENPLSWCKVEINCASIVDVIKVNESIPLPPLTVATINFRHYLNAETNQNEILMMSCVTQTRYAVDKKQPTPAFDQHFCGITCPSNQPFPLNIHDCLKSYKGTRVQKMDSEKALLTYFSTQLSMIDPDLIVGHGLQSFQIDLLADRLIKRNVSTFSKYSRLKRTDKKKLHRELFTGRLVCDIKISAKELIKSKSYDLVTLCQEVLKIPETKIVDLEPDEIVKMYGNSQNIIKLITYVMQDTSYILKMLYDLNVIPLALQITTIAGNIMSRTLIGGRSERNEFLLLHAFYEKGYIVPDKRYKRRCVDDYHDDIDQKPSTKKPTYSGGLVLEPKVGFFDKLLLLMDFNSLYPSIIQEYNICFTTLPITDDDILVLPDRNLPPGILPVEIRKLVDSRKQVKSLMAAPDFSPDLKMHYHIRQMALKLTANSMYGCLGFSNSRFYAKNLAALITQKGREILTNTKDLVEKMCFEVVYGDTDSIMINTNMLDFDQVFKTGNKIKQEVNKLYKMVELDIDGIFKYLLLLKKKKYAAVVLTKTPDGQLKEEIEYKGLDIVRRDWSQLACEAGKYVLEHILSDQSEDDRISNIQIYLRKLQEDLKEEKVPVPLLIIRKQLTKDPNMYPNKDSLPHVQVAIRYNKEHGGHFRAGDTIFYVICDDGSDKSATQRAYHPEELKLREDLKIDYKYYLAHQIHPVVARICNPIQGLDSYEIAQCLGLDGNAFKKPAPKLEYIGHNITTPEVKFRDISNFSFKCLDCQTENVVSGPLNGDTPFLARCSNGDCTSKPIDYLYYIQNQLSLTINSYIMRYYENKLICEDPSCPNEIYRLPLDFAGKFPICTLCGSGVMYREYTDMQLFAQLSYFVYIFNPNNFAKKPVFEETISRGYQQLGEIAEKYLSVSAYSLIDLAEIFSFMMGQKKPTSNHEEPLSVEKELYFSDSE